MFGGADNDILVGGEDNDLLYGENGADTFWLDHLTGRDTIDGGEGGTDLDRLEFQPSNTGVNVTFTGNQAGTYSVPGSNASGVFFEIEQIDGSGFDDTVNAAASATSVDIFGAAGNDSITGGGGNDRLEGGGRATTP